MPKDLEKELKELFTRFILNAPQQHKSTLFRVCYELEQAFWFYLDVCREKNPQLPHFKFVEFMELMFDRFSNETLPRPKELDISKIHKWLVVVFYALKLIARLHTQASVKTLENSS